jgi:uncharacterized protein
MALSFLRFGWHAAACLALIAGSAVAGPQTGPQTGLQTGPHTASKQTRLAAAVQQFEAGQMPQARAAFEALSRQGLPAAQYNLAVMHLQGHTRPAGSPASAAQKAADQKTAEALLTRAAKGGFVTAQFMLGQALESGQLGRRDLVLAHRWYEVAALAGSVPAQVAMGTAYYLGRGRSKDPQQALHWFREGAKGGDLGAMYLLASMYEQGDGTDVDLRLARYWYGIAAEQGDEAAPGKVKELDAQLAKPAASLTS